MTLVGAVVVGSISDNKMNAFQVLPALGLASDDIMTLSTSGGSDVVSMNSIV